MFKWHRLSVSIGSIEDLPFFILENVLKITIPLQGWRDYFVVKGTCYSCWGHVLVPRTHVVTHNHLIYNSKLQLQFQSFLWLLPTCAGPIHAYSTHKYMQTDSGMLNKWKRERLSSQKEFTWNINMFSYSIKMCLSKVYVINANKYYEVSQDGVNYYFKWFRKIAKCLHPFAYVWKCIQNHLES